MLMKPKVFLQINLNAVFCKKGSASFSLFYYASLTNIRQEVKQDTSFQPQVSNNLIKLEFI